MGRKSIDKNRKGPQAKTDRWLLDLIPKLKDQDLASMTMNDLAKLLGKSKSTLYEYFESKEEILTRAVALRIERIAAYRELLHRPGSESEVYQSVLEFLCEQLGDISIQLLEQIQTHLPLIWEQIDQFLQLIIDDLGTLYERGMEKGVFRPTSIRLLTRLDHFFVTQLITDKVFKEEQDVSLDQLVRYYLELRFSGIRT
ncbi:MAG: TetR/AcrR family transcriptional regulator [Bacteroidota bacterium]